MFARLLLLLLLASPILAAPSLVSAVNMPAWLDRGDQSLPLQAGSTVKPGDVLRTGAGGRVLLTLPEGSVIKIGADAVFRVENLGLDDGRNKPFAAAFEVLKGAFRFTTAILTRPRLRQVDIRINTVTAGIRGTDIWGKSDADKDLVCLLEGKITASHEGEAGEVLLDQPLDFYVAPRGKPAKPKAKVDMDKVVKEWAPMTEPQAGLARSDGRWRLVLVQADTQEQALDWYDRLREAGYAARIRPLDGGRYRVSLERLSSQMDGHALGERLQKEMQTPLMELVAM